jgi:hypothetical protein
MQHILMATGALSIRPSILNLIAIIVCHTGA